jgi:CPA2 family monovalent cation:H+ antiporter-2
MHDIELIRTLTGGLVTALICGYITFRLGLSPIVGYLLAGFLVGPNTPGMVVNRELADQFAEVGVILLMFGVGLQFHFKELLAVRRVAVPGAVGQSVAATVLGTLVGVGSGWGWSAGLVFGMAISVASTVVLVRILADNDDLHTVTGHIAVGWLVVEDLLTVFVLVLLPVLVGPGGGGVGTVVLNVGAAIVKLAAMVALTFVVGERVIPWLLDRAAATRSRELFTLTVLGTALGIAVGSAQLFDVSMALGAFLAGMVVGRTQFSLRAATEALPMRDAFAVLFFVSVGLLFDPRHTLDAPGPVLATLGVILIGKPLAALIIVLLLRYPIRVALAVGVALAQIGEFSFILATAGRGLGVLDDRITNTLITASIISISLNPILYRLIDPLDRLIRRFVTWPAPAVHAAAGATAAEPQPSDRRRAVIVGYGPVGRTLARLLRENGFEPVIIELNVETVRELVAGGHRAVYGDATHSQTLKEAGLADAVALVLSSSSVRGASEAIRAARELNPRLVIFSRTNYLSEMQALRAAGADAVFSGEGEVALAMTEFLLRQFGATPDQIDCERARIRSEYIGSPEGESLSDDRAWPGDEVQTQPREAATSE